MSYRGTKDGGQVLCARWERHLPGPAEGRSGPVGNPWDSAAAGGALNGAAREAPGCPARLRDRALRTVVAKALRGVLAAPGAARGSATVRLFVRQWQRKQIYNFVGDGRPDSGWSATVVSSCVTNFAVKAAVNAQLRPWVSL